MAFEDDETYNWYLREINYYDTDDYDDDYDFDDYVDYDDDDLQYLNYAFKNFSLDESEQENSDYLIDVDDHDHASEVTDENIQDLDNLFDNYSGAESVKESSHHLIDVGDHDHAKELNDGNIQYLDGPVENYNNVESEEEGSICIKYLDSKLVSDDYEGYLRSDDDQNEHYCGGVQDVSRTDDAESDRDIKVSDPVKVERNDDILIGVLNSFIENIDDAFTDLIKNGNIYARKALLPSDFEYSCIKNKFDNSMKNGTKLVCRFYRVRNIEKICCPYLLAQFKIKEEKKREAEGVVFEEEVYHGTEKAKIPSICKNSFDWRKCGTHVGTKFGKGISFAKYATYASFYPKIKEEPRAMLVTKILYFRKQVGNSCHTIPDEGYDTTTNGKNSQIWMGSILCHEFFLRDALSPRQHAQEAKSDDFSRPLCWKRDGIGQFFYYCSRISLLYDNK